MVGLESLSQPREPQPKFPLNSALKLFLPLPLLPEGTRGQPTSGLSQPREPHLKFLEIQLSNSFSLCLCCPRELAAARGNSAGNQLRKPLPTTREPQPKFPLNSALKLFHSLCLCCPGNSPLPEGTRGQPTSKSSAKIPSKFALKLFLLCFQCTRRDSNPQPTEPESVILSN